MRFLWLIGILIWGGALLNGFVGDDLGYVYHPFIQKMEIARLFAGSSSDLGGSSPITGYFYRPLMLLSLSWLYKIFGLNAWGYHLFQILLSIVNCYLVFFLFRRFFKKDLSIILAIIFLVHPINAETVLYLSNLQDVLMVLFGLIGILKYWPFLLLSMLSKETGIIFLVLYITLNKQKWKNVLAILLVYLSIRWTAGLGMGTGLGQLGWPSVDVVWYYLKTFLLPINLAIGQVWIPENTTVKAVILGIFAAIIMIVFIWNKKYRLWLGWSIVALLPHIQIIPLEMTVADRWGYSLSIGLIGIVGQVGRNWKKWIWGIIIVVMATRSLLRVANFRDNLSLLTHDSKITDSYLLEQSLGYYLMENSQMDKALSALEKSLRLRENPVNTNTIGVYYFRVNQIEKAKTFWKRSIALGDNFQAYNNLSRVLLSQEKWDEARPIIEKGKVKFPQTNLFEYFESYMTQKQNK